MPPKKKARASHDPNDVFVVTSTTTKDQIPRNVKRVRIDGSVSILPDKLFHKSTSVVEVVFEEGVHTIGKNAFSFCKALSKVQLPSTLREILDCVFYGCVKLTAIDLPEGLQMIGQCVFYRTGLRFLDVPPTVRRIGGGSFANCHELESIVLPPILEAIEYELFYACHQLEEIEIPRTIKAIEYYAFCGCSALKYLDFLLCSQCLRIGYCAFSSCSNLSVIHLPPNLEGSIARGTFAHCTSLTHVRIPPRVSAIESKGEAHPFDLCSSLMSLELPEGLETISVLPGPIGFPEFTGITRCPLLVNLSLPSTQQIEFFDNRPLSSEIRLRGVAEDREDLVTRLQHRFDDHPLHRICYFHSYHPVEDSIRGMRAILQTKPNAITDLDSFGMTPLHILTLAQQPKIELIQELFSSVDAALSPRDYFGSTPLEYPCKNSSEDALSATRWLIRKVVEERSPFLGFDRWKKALLLRQERIIQAEAASTMSHNVKLLLEELSKVEFLEVLSLLEMKLWKMKLEENHPVDTLVIRNTMLQKTDDRQSCRVHCGISIVIESILPFLGKRALCSSQLEIG